MAFAPPRPCTHPHCPSLATVRGRCAAHQRPSAYQRGYLTGWAAYAKDWLARFPWCGQRSDGLFYQEHSVCAQRQLHVKARVVDHIRSLAAGGSLMDPHNHQSLCVSCNTKKG